jgi:hypothetical protein
MAELLQERTFTKKELEASTMINDQIRPLIKEAVSKRSIFLNPLMRELSKFADKNSNVLQTNIVGRQLLINSDMQDNILKIFGIDRKDIISAIKESPYFSGFGGLKLMDQLIFSIPLMLASGELYKMNKKKESEMLYLSAFYKPYASIVFRHFKYGVNEDQMMYTIENLTERFDIKREDSVIGALEKMADSSFKNYLKYLTADTISDKDIHVIYTAGIQSRISSFMKSIYNEYQKNKGKYLPYEDSTFEGTDDSEGEEFSRDIKSDAAIKNQAVKKAVNTLLKSPIDEELIDIAAKYSFTDKSKTYGNYKYSGLYTDILKNTISEIIDNKYRKLPEFIESIIGSFLFNISPYTEQKYSAADLRTPTFITASLKIFKSPNTKDRNMLTVKKMLEEFLRSYSVEYLNFGKTQQGKLKNAVFFYFVLVIQKG